MVIALLEGLTITARWQWMLVALVVIGIGPLVEECIFRGVVTHSFMQQRGYKGVILAALIFAAVHAERAVVWNLVILSLFLGTIYWKTKSMRYSFLFHVGINSLAFLVLFLSHVYPEMIVR
jgi:membrane protease YdiL (CAAX protease family)